MYAPKRSFEIHEATLTDLKGEIDKSTIKIGNFRTLSVIQLADRKSEVDRVLEQHYQRKFNLINIYRTLHKATAEYTLLSYTEH